MFLHGAVFLLTVTLTGDIDRLWLDFVRGGVRCFFVAGFVRIRCDSVEGIRLLTNPTTLNTHHSQSI